MSSHLDVASQITRLKAHLANIRSTSHVWSTEAGFHLVCVRVGGDIGKVYEAGRVVKPLLGASVSTTTTSPPEVPLVYAQRPPKPAKIDLGPCQDLEGTAF
eukprot:scaffold20095_cov62-Phaeocystis_antarctica.AAC.3